MHNSIHKATRRVTFAQWTGNQMIFVYIQSVISQIGNKSLAVTQRRIISYVRNVYLKIK